MIREVNLQSRGSESWRYYDATVLGFLVWYQSLIKQGRSPVFLPKNYQRFFPSISKHWKKLEVVFKNDREGLDADYFFTKSVNKISFSLQKNDDFFAYDTKIFEPILSSVTLSFNDYELSINSDFVIDTPMLKWKRKDEVRPDFDERELQMQNISNKITFLFFYNMLQRPCSYEVEGGSIYLRSIFDDYIDEGEMGEKLRNNYHKTIGDILAIINNDETLKKIFNKGLKLIDHTHKKPQIVEFLEKSLS